MPYCHKSRILERLLRRAHKMRDDRKHIQEHTEKNCTDHPQADPDHSEEHGILRINNIKIHSNECDNQRYNTHTMVLCLKFCRKAFQKFRQI